MANPNVVHDMAVERSGILMRPIKGMVNLNTPEGRYQTYLEGRVAELEAEIKELKKKKTSAKKKTGSKR